MRKIFIVTLLNCLSIFAWSQNPYETKTIEHDNLSRSYLQYSPDDITSSRKKPVLFALHGITGTSQQIVDSSHFERLAPGWIIIVPQALDEATYSFVMTVEACWGASVGPRNFSFLGDVNLNSKVDDEGFFMAILDKLEADYNVDTDSVFFAGFSMGGFMANKMGIKHADRITAIAAISGTIGNFQNFNPVAKLNTLHIHGTADKTVSYESATFKYEEYDIGSVGLGAEATVESWRVFNGCNSVPIHKYYPNTKNDGYTFEKFIYNSNDGVKTVFIKGNGVKHDWLTKNCDINYNEEIYNFFTGKEDATSAPKIVTNAIKLFPNPATDFVTITIDEPCELNIYNALQQKIATHPLFMGENTIDVSNLPEGMYVFSTNKITESVIITK